MKYHYQERVIIPFAKSHKRLVTAMVAVIFAFMWYVALLARANAVTTTVVVTENDLETPTLPFETQETWYFYDDTNNLAFDSESVPNYQISDGPGVPALGDGSVNFELTGSSERWNIATNQFAGTDLSDIDSLSFDMYVPSTSTGGTGTTLFMNIDVDFDNTAINGYQGRLVYVPGDNGAPTADTWETWDGVDGGDAMWRYSRATWPGTSTPGTTARSWDDITSSYPNAEVLFETFTGQFLIRAGHPGPAGLQGAVDNIVMNEMAFNFEPFKNSLVINSPADGDFVRRNITLSATYNDGNSDNENPMNWAVRPDSPDCSTGPNEFGGGPNVSGVLNSTNSESWDGESFEAVINTRRMDDGVYCFVANPREPSNEVDTREIVRFTVDNTRPVVMIDAPSEGDNVSGTFDVLATVSDDNMDRYRVRIYDEDGTQVWNSGWTVDMDGLTSEVAAVIDSMAFEDGMYRIRLTARDLAGWVQHDNVWVEFDNYVTDKDECKKGGWEDGLFGGQEFRNQGDCVSHFSSDTQAEFNPDALRGGNRNR